MPPRLTQRAPRSCLSCSQRKVKCNKRVPCEACIRRGDASKCAREKVIVKGELPSANLYEGLDYDELVLENLRLRSAVLGKSEEQSVEEIFIPDTAASNSEYLNELLDGWNNTRPSSVWQQECVTFPSRSLSMSLMDIAARHASWTHFVIHYPTFLDEHEKFWSLEVDHSETIIFDSRWLAVYFSILSTVLNLRDKNTSPSMVNLEGNDVQHWIDCALFYLAEAEFLRIPHVQCLQAAVLLKDTFTFEDQRRCFMDLWPVALQMAQQLGMDDEIKLAQRTMLDAEICRRIWWSLVLAEWLIMPLRSPGIHNKDFNVNMPCILDDDELSGLTFPERTLEYPRPIHYQIALIRGAKINYEFHQAALNGKWTSESFTTLVMRTDERIAQVITYLPSYLKAEYDPATQDPEIEIKYPGMSQQRVNICFLLLEGRLGVNEWLRGLPKPSETQSLRLKSICGGSSRTLLNVAANAPLDQLKPWFNISGIFRAVATLITAIASNPDSVECPNDVKLVKQGCNLLRLAQPESRLAGTASRILEGRVKELAAAFAGDLLL